MIVGDVPFAACYSTWRARSRFKTFLPAPTEAHQRKNDVMFSRLASTQKMYGVLLANQIAYDYMTIACHVYFASLSHLCSAEKLTFTNRMNIN